EGPAVNSRGEVYFTDIPGNRIHRIDLEGRVSVFAEQTARTNGLMFGPDGKLYGCRNGEQQIVRYDKSGHHETVLENAPANDLVLLHNGTGYYTDPNNRKVWFFKPDGTRRVVDEGIEFPNGIITSADQAFLTVSDTRGRFTYSFRIQTDGTLTDRQKYGHLHIADSSSRSGADGMTVDVAGRTYVTTELGLQVLDQPGRVHIILNKPSDGWLSNVVFGGRELDTLFVTCGDRVFKRKIRTRGVIPWQAPPEQPRPRL
ncbi:MAG: SMP-30/gluconolactonase/LRE family protein, partial [Planctomycetaceae bacterium]